MFRRKDFLHGLLSLCLAALVAPCVQAQGGAITAQVGHPGPAAERSSIRLPKKYQEPAELAKFIQLQPPGSQLDLALYEPPSPAIVAALLPTGTVFKDNLITLPNGTAAALVRRKTDKEYEAEFLAQTSTRDQIIDTLKTLSSHTTIYVREPGGATVVMKGDISLAMKIVENLPSGTFVTAKETETKITIRYPKIK